MFRSRFYLLVVCAAVAAQPLLAQETAQTDLRTFLSGLWPEAQKRGVSRATFDNAVRGIAPDDEVLRLTKSQPEYNRPIGDYLKNRLTANLLASGKKHAEKWAETLDAVERKYGVDKEIIVAIWGLETGYGSFSGGKDVIRSLATLAHARYRGDFFRNELLAALEILEQEHITRDKMRGSWAGAMGQPQFIPSSFLKFAVDFSGDGRRDIWSNTPDVLGSIGNYLRQHGWKPGIPWGYEVTIPRDFDYRKSRASFAEWYALGVRRADGGKFPASSDGILFFPSGASGPGFVVTGNYEAIKRYNLSDAYSLTVAGTANRLKGMDGYRGKWPEVVPLNREHRIRMQKLMQAKGYPVNNVVGQIDFDLRDQIRILQVKFGLLPDGHPTETFLQRLEKL
ncbi:MAG: lytic murein transglycosylase [Xanthobacteraceae bacterium]|nr:lytic murein transglycosylase [Xanthobacteraceae bacterium]